MLLKVIDQVLNYFGDYYGLAASGWTLENANLICSLLLKERVKLVGQLLYRRHLVRL